MGAACDVGGNSITCKKTFWIVATLGGQAGSLLAEHTQKNMRSCSEIITSNWKKIDRELCGVDGLATTTPPEP